MSSIKGREALSRKFLAMPVAVRAEISRAVPAAAERLMGMQKRLAPRDKGALIDSIRDEIGTGGDAYRATVMAGGTEATRREVRKGSGIFTDEGRLVEFGTKPHKNKGRFAGTQNPGTPPRPFFYPAWRALKKQLKGSLSRSISRGIKKAASS